MMLFHLRSAVRTSFFVQLMVTSTLSILALQLLAAHAVGSSGSDAWIRAGLVGTWTTSTVAAGIVGFQRFQGTLAYLVLTPRQPFAVFMPLVSGAATLGLAAFPLAALASFAVGTSPSISDPFTFALGVFAFWLGCLSLACVIASLFVLTPNAITYEGLLVIPLILLSGVFGSPESPILDVVSRILPLTTPVNVLVDGSPVVSLLSWILVVAGWYGLAGLLFQRALNMARVAGTLEVT